MRAMILTVLALFWAAVLALTGGRLLALLSGANEESELIRKLYDWSEFWVEPFFRMFGLQNEAVTKTGGVFEPASLIAFVVYVAFGAFLWTIVSGAASTRVASCVDTTSNGPANPDRTTPYSGS